MYTCTACMYRQGICAAMYGFCRYVCMQETVHVSIYLIYLSTYLCNSVSLPACLIAWLPVCVCMYRSTDVQLHVYLYVYKMPMSIRIYVDMYVGMHVCTQGCMYACT